MLIVGMTGGIGSGKSTVADMFAELGAEIIDTDSIAHTLTAQGQPALQTIAAQLGSEFLTADNTLDRAALRQLVFTQPAARKTLENILHPLIRQSVQEKLSQPTPAAYRIVVVPLLFESGSYASLVQRTLVVDCPEHLQIERATARSRLTESEVRAMMAAQFSRDARLARADDIIVNDADLKNLLLKVEELHKKYISLA